MGICIITEKDELQYIVKEEIINRWKGKNIYGASFRFHVIS